MNDDKNLRTQQNITNWAIFIYSIYSISKLKKVAWIIYLSFLIVLFRFVCNVCVRNSFSRSTLKKLMLFVVVVIVVVERTFMANNKKSYSSRSWCLPFCTGSFFEINFACCKRRGVNSPKNIFIYFFFYGKNSTNYTK